MSLLSDDTGCTDTGEWVHETDPKSLKISKDFVEFVVDLMHEIVRAVTSEVAFSLRLRKFSVSSLEVPQHWCPHLALITQDGESLLKAIHMQSGTHRQTATIGTLEKQTLRLSQLLKRVHSEDARPDLEAEQKDDVRFTKETKLTWGELLQRVRKIVNVTWKFRYFPRTQVDSVILQLFLCSSDLRSDGHWILQSSVSPRKTSDAGCASLKAVPQPQKCVQ